MIDIKEHEELSRLNHSCAHMMAQAVKRLYPQAKFWVGPVISEGFYYDIDLGDEVIKEEDKRKPLSDQAISEILKEKGMVISRRTVAKYREELGIKSSSKRKRF